MRFAIPSVFAAITLLGSPCLAQVPVVYEPVNEDGFRAISAGGFGDRLNTWAASMQWFQGNLYVGTSRAAQCVTLASLGSLLPVDLYPFLGPGCPPDAADLPLAAEIWRYRPSSAQWDLVYRSPVDIPVRFDIQRRPTKFTARDIAFRSMAVVKEAGGTEALYVGGMSAAEVFPGAFTKLPNPPPARILRTSDGTTWQAIPQTPGTLLGDLGKGIPGSQVKPVMFNALVGFRGRLFAVAGDSLGNNVILASSEPATGNDAWNVASAPPETFPVSALAVYNDMLYCAVSGRRGSPYRIFKADAAGAVPLAFSLVMTGGDGQPEAGAAWRAVSLAEFRGRLYVATGLPPELVRIDADDSWELMIGTPRATDAGLKRPLSGVSLGLGSAFSAQFRTLAAHEGKLYLGTSDWSQSLEVVPPLSDAATFEFGFDLFRSDDAISWVSITRKGLGEDHQPIVQSMASTPAGLFVGSASVPVGGRVWQKDPAKAKSPGAPDPPERVEAVSEEVDDTSVILSWELSAGAKRYHVYRSTVTPLLEILGTELDLASLLDALQGFCDQIPLVCGLLGALQNDFGVPSPFVLVGTTTDRFLLDTRDSTLPALYFVVAEGGSGTLSGISNTAGGPSRAALITFPNVADRLDAANLNQPSKSRMRILKFLRRAQAAARAGDLTLSERLVRAAEKGLKQGPVAQRLAATEVQDLTYFLQGVQRNVWLGEQDLIPLHAVVEGIN